MRLLNIHTLEFQEFHGNDTPDYIIASHRWYEQHLETTYKDVLKKRRQELDGFQKVKQFCAFIQGSKVDVEWFWIDTCCIDKRSSTELQESINSMFRWYRSSRCCLAYLADVGPLSDGQEVVMEAFRDSVWFTRAWTLQELLAPTTVLFVNRDWEIIGHKGRIRSGMADLVKSGNDLTDEIAEITGIRKPVLLDVTMSKNIPFEEKQGWVMHRETTREEDKAYCLLGIFNISMPLVYGEGRKSFKRFLREVEEKERDTARKKLKKQKKMEKKMRAQIEAAEEAEPAPLTPIPESPLIEVKTPRNVEHTTPLPVIPIPGLPTAREPVQTRSQRYAAIASALRKLWLAASSREQAISAVASILEERGYDLPGDMIHEALHDMERISNLAQTAHTDMLTAGWQPGDALAHIESVSQQEGHTPEMAAAIVQEYMMYDAALVDRGTFPFIPPSTSYVSARHALEIEQLRECLIEQEESRAALELQRRQRRYEHQLDRGILEDLTPLSRSAFSTSAIDTPALQSHGSEVTHPKPQIDNIQEPDKAPESPKLYGHGLARASQNATKDKDSEATATAPFDLFATMHLFS